MRIKYTFLLIFLVLTQIAIASSEIQVLYFYSSACPISKQIEPFKNVVKSYWEEKVNWIDYDFMEEENIDLFTKYKIANFPVALVNCFNKTYRIERDEVKEKLDRTIAECYGLEERIPKGIFLILGLVFVVFLVLKKPKKKAKRRYRS